MEPNQTHWTEIELYVIKADHYPDLDQTSLWFSSAFSSPFHQFSLKSMLYHPIGYWAERAAFEYQIAIIDDHMGLWKQSCLCPLGNSQIFD